MDVRIDDSPITSERDLELHRDKLDVLRTGLEDLKIEVQQAEASRLKHNRWAKPAPFRFRKTFTRIGRAISYLEAKIAVWEVQNM